MYDPHSVAHKSRHAGAEREQLLRAFDQASGFIVVIKGPEHVVEYVNNAHRRLFNSKEWVGRTIRHAFPDVAGQGFFELLDRVCARGERFVADGAFVRFRLSPDGRRSAFPASFMSPFVMRLE